MKNIGKYFIFIGSMFTNMERFPIYVRLTFEEATKIGVNSIFLIAIVSTFMGAVTTIQTAYNLISPLIPNEVISLVVRDMTLLELAPTVTAIVFAGKVGSNLAGELGTMRITEQIDALEVMGINSSSYLVLPKIIGTLLMYPCLVILSGFLSIYGGYITASLTGVVTEQEYIAGIRLDFLPRNIGFALIKSVAFAFLISSISSFKGFYTVGGALEVGKASTSAVTNSCIAILLADYLLAQLILG